MKWRRRSAGRLPAQGSNRFGRVVVGRLRFTPL